MASCDVLGGVYALFLQGLLFLISLAVLAYKYKLDSAGRTPTQFIFDSSKQIIGAGWIHVMNMGFAMLLGAHSSKEGSDECEWYWMEIMVDTTIGVAIEYYLLTLAVWAIARAWSRERAQEMSGGVYVDGSGKFLLGSYGRQLLLWLAIVTGMKVILVLFLVSFQEFFQMIAVHVLRPFMESPAQKLLVVMIITPLVMNTLQFWLVDNIFVHAREGRRAASVRGQEVSVATTYRAM